MLFVKKKEYNKGGDCTNTAGEDKNMCLLYLWCSSPSVVLLQVELWRRRRR
jgi:hypothetical protein